jgi:hypothetical protein
MDTTVGLGELAVPSGPELVSLALEERWVATTGGPNARGVSPKLLNVIIQ